MSGPPSSIFNPERLGFRFNSMESMHDRRAENKALELQCRFLALESLFRGLGFRVLSRGF